MKAAAKQGDKMKITKKWLKNKNACSEAVDEFLKQKETDAEKILSLLVKQEKYDWANWLITRCMTYKQYVSYAIFATEQVIDNYKREDDDRPHRAIAATKKCIDNPTNGNKRVAAWATNEASASWAAIAGNVALQLKILKYGIKLLR